MGRTPDPGGDHGYDEVHRDLPPERAASDDPATPRPPGRDPGGDYGYDEAHDF